MLKDFKKPDLKAPRFRPKRKEFLNKELFKEFLEKYPQYKDLSYDDYYNIIETTNGNFWKTVINLRDGVELPQSLGTLFIATCRANKNNVDYYASKIYGKKLRNRNFESDNYLAKIFYTNFSNKYKFKNREVWTFTSIRQFKRATAAAYPEKWKQYVMVEPLTRVSEIFKGHMKKDWLQKRAEDFDPKTYNEFQL